MKNQCDSSGCRTKHKRSTPQSTKKHLILKSVISNDFHYLFHKNLFHKFILIYQAVEIEQWTEQYVVACSTRWNSIGGWTFIRQQNGFAKVKFWGELRKRRHDKKIHAFLSKYFCCQRLCGTEFLTSTIWYEFGTGIDCQLYIVAANTCIHNHRHLQRWTRCHQENCQEKGT